MSLPEPAASVSLPLPPTQGVIRRRPLELEGIIAAAGDGPRRDVEARAAASVSLPLPPAKTKLCHSGGISSEVAYPEGRGILVHPTVTGPLLTPWCCAQVTLSAAAVPLKVTTPPCCVTFGQVAVRPAAAGLGGPGRRALVVEHGDVDPPIPAHAEEQQVDLA